ncbi:MAG: cytochrome c [Deltaproteobacteria bacterium]|nr:cytochrome c [Deltaproteobacteria bacterium]
MLGHQSHIRKILFTGAFLGFWTAGSAFADAGPGTTPERVAQGQALYQAKCAFCHGDKADGKGPAGKAMKPAPRNLLTGKFEKGDQPQNIFQTITKGLPKTSMPGYPNLSPDESWNLTYYVSSLRSKKAKNKK